MQLAAIICGELNVSITEVESWGFEKFRGYAEVALAQKLAGVDKEAADWIWGEYMRGENNADRFKLKEIGNKTKHLVR